MSSPRRGAIGDAFVVLFGAAKGCLTLLRPAFVADPYGPAHYASIADVLDLQRAIAQSAAPLGAGAAYDALGRYDPILWTLVLVSALASLCLLRPGEISIHGLPSIPASDRIASLKSAAASAGARVAAI